MTTVSRWDQDLRDIARRFESREFYITRDEVQPLMQAAGRIATELKVGSTRLETIPGGVRVRFSRAGSAQSFVH